MVSIRMRSPNELKALRDCSDSGQSFRTAIEAIGYVLARGDRRDFVVVDRTGGDYSLARQLGMKAAELRAFMKDVETASLPSVANAKTLQQQRQAVRAARRAQASTAEVAAPNRRRTASADRQQAEKGKAGRQRRRRLGRWPDRRKWVRDASAKRSGVPARSRSSSEYREPACRGCDSLPGIAEARATFEFERYAAMAFRPEVIDIRSQQHAGADEARIVRDQAEQADRDIRSLVQKAGHGGQAVRKTGQALEIIPPACRSAEREEEPRREQEQREPERDR